MKQTAVEWLCNQIYTIQVELEAGNTILKNKIEQAKELEKEQQGYSEEEVLELLKDFEKEKSSKVIFAKNWFNKFKKR